MDPIEGSQDVARKRLHRFRVQNAASIILFLQSAMVDSIRKAELGDILHSSKYAAPRSMVLGFFGTFFLTLVPCVTLLHLPVHRHRHGLHRHARHARHTHGGRHSGHGRHTHGVSTHRHLNVLELRLLLNKARHGLGSIGGRHGRKLAVGLHHDRLGGAEAIPHLEDVTGSDNQNHQGSKDDGGNDSSKLHLFVVIIIHKRAPVSVGIGIRARDVVFRRAAFLWKNNKTRVSAATDTSNDYSYRRKHISTRAERTGAQTLRLAATKIELLWGPGAEEYDSHTWCTCSLRISRDLLVGVYGCTRRERASANVRLRLRRPTPESTGMCVALK